MQSGNPSATGQYGLGQYVAKRQDAQRQNPDQSQRDHRQLGQHNYGGSTGLGESLRHLAQQCCSGTADLNVGSTERIFSTGMGGMLIASGLLRGRLPGLLLTAIGGALLYRGITGHCSVYQQLGFNTSEMEGERSITKGVKIEESVTIARPAHDLYEVWTQWERLPEILPHIDEVKDLGQGRTRWTARGPLGTRLTWEAEVINQETDRLIAWQSLNGGDVDTAGSVHFNAQGANATEMVVSMQYEPPGGRLTAMVSEFLGVGLDQRVRRDLQRFKSSMESQQSGTQGAHAAMDSSELAAGGSKSGSNAGKKSS